MELIFVISLVVLNVLLVSKSITRNSARGTKQFSLLLEGHSAMPHVPLFLYNVSLAKIMAEPESIQRF